MPVVTVAMPPHPDGEALLDQVADGVAASLGLGQGDVVCVHIPTGPARVSGRPEERATWALLTIHGSSRGADGERRAREAAETAVHGWARGIAEPISVWTEWQAPSAADPAQTVSSR